MNKAEWENTLASPVFQEFIKNAQIKDNKIDTEQFEDFESKILKSEKLTQVFKILQKAACLKDKRLSHLSEKTLKSLEMLVLP